MGTRVCSGRASCTKISSGIHQLSLVIGAGGRQLRGKNVCGILMMQESTNVDDSKRLQKCTMSKCLPYIPIRLRLNALSLHSDYDVPSAQKINARFRFRPARFRFLACKISFLIVRFCFRPARFCFQPQDFIFNSQDFVFDCQVC
jgi:hypothetical protein